MYNNSYKKQMTRKQTLKRKQFKERNSTLTELSETKHFHTIKHLFFILLLSFFMKDLAFSFVLNRKVDYGLRLTISGFGKIHVGLLLWCIMFSVNILTFYFFSLWVNIRGHLFQKSSSFKFYSDCFFICLIVAYYLGTLFILPRLIQLLELPILTATFVTTEQIRLLMKSHSFVRENVPNVLSYKPHSEKELFRSSLTHYLYFSFAPTLLYQHEYPRTKYINWKYATQCFFEVLASVWLLSYIMDMLFITKFEKMFQTQLRWSYVFAVILEGVLGGLLTLILIFYIALHSIQNCFAEILKFGDRKFYEDWWTTTNFRIYFRKWNVIVHDWLFEYVYKEFYETITQKNKLIAKVMVFLISAFAHEYILSVAGQQFFPFLSFSFFIAGTLISFLNSERVIYNMFLLYGLSFGLSLHISLYTLEGLARRHCLEEEYNSTVAYFIPRIFFHGCINSW